MKTLFVLLLASTVCLHALPTFAQEGCNGTRQLTACTPAESSGGGAGCLITSSNPNGTHNCLATFNSGVGTHTCSVWFSACAKSGIDPACPIWDNGWFRYECGIASGTTWKTCRPITASANAPRLVGEPLCTPDYDELISTPPSPAWYSHWDCYPTCINWQPDPNGTTTPIDIADVVLDPCPPT